MFAILEKYSNVLLNNGRIRLPVSTAPLGRTYELTARKYWAQSNVFRTYGRVSRGLSPRVRKYGTPYWQSNTTIWAQISSSSVDHQR